MTARDAATAYDAIAASYDDLLAGDGWMRSVLWSRYARLFRPGERVLDVGCGTGEDALFLAGRGVSVLGIDVSPEMIARLREKAGAAGGGPAGLDASEHSVKPRPYPAPMGEPAPTGRRSTGPLATKGGRLGGSLALPAGTVEARVMDLADLFSLPDGGFDGIISAFAGLSSTPDLRPFAREAARLLRPGGRMTVHMLNRSSLWEWMGALRRGEWRAAGDAGRAGEREFRIGGTPVRHYLYHPEEAYGRFFEPRFALVDSFALGCLRPPHTVRRVPRPAAEMLGRLEGFAGRRRPFLNWGRFFVLVLRKR